MDNLNTTNNVSSDPVQVATTSNVTSSSTGPVGAASIQDDRSQTENSSLQNTQVQPAVATAGLSGAMGGNYDPNNPGYQTVDNAYNQLVNQDSPMMQQAKAAAQRAAAQRGLGNSSMAVGAGQAAASQAALPMASQMASQSQNQSQYDRSQTEAERAAQSNEGMQQQQITNQNTQFGKTLEEQQAAREQQNTQFGQNLAEQQAGREQQNTQFGKSLEQQQAEQKQQQSQFQQSQSQQQSQFQQQLAQEAQKIKEQSNQFANSIQANARGAYTDSVNNIMNNSSVNINNISSNANISQANKDKLIAQEIANRNNDLKYLQSLYGSVTSWADKL